jgi:hypothetical protein
VGVGQDNEALAVAVLVLIVIACVVALLIVWRDDHKDVDLRRH